MALLIVGGDSGHGKTTSIRNLDPKTTFIIQIISKPLPFKGWKTNYPLMDKTTYVGNRYILFDEEYDGKKNAAEVYLGASKRLRSILRLIAVKKPEIKTIVMDDTQYIMSYEYMARAKEKGFDRFNAIAENFFNAVQTATSISHEIDVVLLHHTEVVDGIRKLKTVGKLLDSMITIEGLFSMVFMTEVERVDGLNIYKFLTHSDGTNTAKTPMGMFDTDDIENDLKVILELIHKFDE